MEEQRKSIGQHLRSWSAVAFWAIAFAVLGQWVIELLKQRTGFYADPSKQLVTFVNWLASMTGSTAFHWMGGIVVGFFGGVRLDDSLRRKEKATKATLPETHRDRIIAHLKAVPVDYERNKRLKREAETLASELHAFVAAYRTPSSVSGGFVQTGGLIGLAPMNPTPSPIDSYVHQYSKRVAAIYSDLRIPGVPDNSSNLSRLGTGNVPSPSSLLEITGMADTIAIHASRLATQKTD